jgi:hypothetical protein
VAGSDNCDGQFGVCHDAQDNTAAAGVQSPTILAAKGSDQCLT